MTRTTLYHYLVGELHQETPESKTSPRGKLERSVTAVRFELNAGGELVMTLGGEAYVFPDDLVPALVAFLEAEGAS